MSTNSVDILNNSFGILKSGVGQKLVGLFLVIQGLNFVSTYLMQEMSMTTVPALLSVAGGLLSVIVTIGGLRSLRDEEFDLGNFKQNLAWPIGRIAGANIVSVIFAYLVALIFIAPAALAALTSGVTSIAGLAGASAGVLALGGLGAILGVAAFIYVSVTLILAQPFVAIDNMRMFEALDKSIRSTKDNRLNIFIAFLGYGIANLALGALFGLIALVGPQVVADALVTIVIGSVMAPVGLKILEEFSRELEP